MIMLGVTSDSLSKPLAVDDEGILRTHLITPDMIYDSGVYTQVQGENSAVAGEVVVYTVPAGNTLYITSILLSTNNAGAAIGASQARFYTAVPALYHTMRSFCAVGNVAVFGISFTIPYFVPSGYTLRVFSPIAGLVATCGFTGYIK